MTIRLLPLSRRSFTLGALALGATTLPLGAAAARLEGQTFPDTIALANANLRLNGLGLRAQSWLKGYVAALYLGQSANTAQAVLAAPGPKRLSLRMLLDAPTEEFIKAIDKGIKRNSTPAQRAPMADRIVTWKQAVLGIGKVHPGDTVNLDYVPGSGMTMSYNGAPRGAAIPGEDFYATVLRIFIGDRPTDEKLKAGLLGVPAR